VGSTTKRNKQREFVFKTKSKRGMVLQQSQIKENNNNLSSSFSNTVDSESSITGCLNLFSFTERLSSIY
jgi:hypothetical protein